MKKEMTPAHKEVYDLINLGHRQVEITKMINKNPAQVAGIVNRLRINGHLPKGTSKGGRKLGSKNVSKIVTSTSMPTPKLTQVVIEQPATDKYVVIVGSNLKEIMSCL